MAGWSGPKLGAMGLALLSTIALGACRQSEDGKYFEVSGRLFEFNYRLARATYVVTLNPMRPMEDGQVAVVTFENPAGGAPFVVDQPIWPKMQHVTLIAPMRFPFASRMRRANCCRRCRRR
jgi:hypothetical protein